MEGVQNTENSRAYFLVISGQSITALNVQLKANDIYGVYLKISLLTFSGECNLDNMRTLCVVCHADVTAAQSAERCSLRKKARKQLKTMMSVLKNIQDSEQNCGQKKVYFLMPKALLVVMSVDTSFAQVRFDF